MVFATLVRVLGSSQYRKVISILYEQLKLEQNTRTLTQINLATLLFLKYFPHYRAVLRIETLKYSIPQ